jgi:hypothetical protein
MDKILNAMPAFLHPLLRNIKANPHKAVEMLPSDDSTRSIKASLKNTLHEMDVAKETLKNISAYVPQGDSLPASAAPQYSDVMENLKPEYLNADQLLETIWIATIGSQTPDGEDVFLKYCKAKFDVEQKKAMSQLIGMSASAQAILQKDTQLLRQFQNNQNYIEKTLQKWEEYVDVHLREQDALYKKLSAVLDTQQRESVFTIADIRSMNTWKRSMEYAFIGIVIVYILFFAIQHYRNLSRLAKKYSGKAAILMNAVKNTGSKLGSVKTKFQ